MKECDISNWEDLPEKNEEQCEVCGKFYLNLTRHKEKVHGFKGQLVLGEVEMKQKTKGWIIIILGIICYPIPGVPSTILIFIGACLISKELDKKVRKMLKKFKHYFKTKEEK